MERIEQTEFGSVFFEEIMIEAGELEFDFVSVKAILLFIFDSFL